MGVVSNPGPVRATPARLWRKPGVAAALLILGLMMAVCLGSVPWLVASEPGDPTPRYNAGRLDDARTPPALSAGARSAGGPSGGAAFWLMGTDGLGRSLFYRSLVGGAISLTVGLAAALISVVIGTAYGAMAGLVGGRIDAILMRTVDVLYGLPYILLVVLLAVAIDATVERRTVARVIQVERQRAAYFDAVMARTPAEHRDDPRYREQAARDAFERYGTGELSPVTQHAVNITTLLVAIGSVSWLTLARVVRGEVLSLKARPFVEAARSIGVSRAAILARHLLPNLAGPIIVYATLAVPQAILQESFLSFLGIGIRPPLPSWGNLAAEGLSEINPYKSNWWLIAAPCVLLGVTLICLNVVGDGLRDVLDPRSKDRRA